MVGGSQKKEKKVGGKVVKIGSEESDRKARRERWRRGE